MTVSSRRYLLLISRCEFTIFFIYKPNLLLKNMKFFLFQCSIRSFVLINMDNMPTVNARLKDERVKR